MASPAPPEVTDRTRRAFRERLTAWYAAHRRDLPWRHTRDPYAITVSEFMLQQTQVATVIPYYGRWLERFPTWGELARAGEEPVIKAWEGLGYYRRARTLHQLAKTVSRRPDGELPDDLEGLLALPGIGPYTARAVGSIAFGLLAAVVDGNVMRVLARVFALEHDIARPATAKLMQALADELAPEDGCGDYNQAVMELGATVCTPRKPTCLVCPLQPVCQAPEPERLPVKTRTRTEAREETVAVIERQHRGQRQWWLERPPEGQRLDALWRFPHVDGTAMELAGDGKPLLKLSYSITKYRVALTAHRAAWSGRAPAANGRQGWRSAEEIEAMALASAHRKVWARIRQVTA